MSGREIPFLSSPYTDNQSMTSGSRSHYIRDHKSSGGSDRDMDEKDDIASHHPSRQSRFQELDSPLRSHASTVRATQGGHTEKRPPGPPGPKGNHTSMVPEDIVTLKPRLRA